MGGRSNTWDGENRLTQCVFSGTTTTHTYGADGYRHQTVNGSNITDFILDGDNAVRTNLNGTVNKTYLHGARGPEYERVGTGAPDWYLYDGLGSVLGTVSPAGVVTHTRKYDVDGAVRGSTGGSGTDHKWCGALGHPSEDATGLVYMRARYYDPVTGGFESEDPAHSGINWIRYSHGAPTVFVDRTGKDDKLPSLEVGMDGAVSVDGVDGLATLNATMVTDGSQAICEVEYIEATAPGQLSIGQLLTAARGWAAGQGINSAYIGGIAGSRLGQGAAIGVAAAIRNLGDGAQLIHEGPWI